MANFRNTNDLKLQVLDRCGEPINGTSDFESDILRNLNSLYQGLIAGGNEFGIDVDEEWVWAKAPFPLVLTLKPPYETGSVSLTNGSRAGTFSDAPAESQQGRYLKMEAREEYFRIREHTGGNATFELDQPYTEASGTFNFKSIKLEYELADDTIIVDETNNKIDFTDTGGTKVATLNSGVYSPSEYATEVQTRLDAASVDTITASFASITRKFTFATDGATFSFLNATGSNVAVNASDEMGLDDEDLTGNITYTSVYPLNAITRFMRPMTVYREFGVEERSFRQFSSTNDDGMISEIGFNSMLRDFPLSRIVEGVPNRYAVTSEEDGIMSVRFNTYVNEDTRVEIEYIPIVKDLKDNAGSIPLVPRAFREYLVFGACYYTMLDKSDNRATGYFQLAQAKLKALVNHNRSDLTAAGINYGRLIPRMSRRRRRFFF